MFGFNFLTLVPMFKSTAPGLLIMAEAFRYGVSKRGGETWKDKSAAHHIGEARCSLILYSGNPTRYSLLADAALRLIFALCLAATAKNYVPKSKANEPLPVACEPLQAEPTGVQDIG